MQPHFALGGLSDGFLADLPPKRPSPRRHPSIPSSTTTSSSPKTVSTESLHSPRPSDPPKSAPLLRKRHSEYGLSSPPDRPTAVPPRTYVRNSARPDNTLLKNPKGKLQSSTKTTRAEQVAQQDLSPASETRETLATPVSDSSSPMSTRFRPSLVTGPVEDVTPWDLYPIPTLTSRSSVSTGRLEDVTPWELYTIPDAIPTRSTLATGPPEEVTPWELFPSPTYDSLPTSATDEKQSYTSPRVSTSSSHQSKTISELAHIRRHRSTGAKVAKPRPSSPSGQLQGETIISASAITQPYVRPSPNRRATAQLSKPSQSTHKGAKTPTHPEVPPVPLLPPVARTQSSTSLGAELKFSTVDRTILEELKRSIKARAEQFVVKGVGSTTENPLERRGKKHHNYPREEVPYPRNYEREVLDLDVWETMFIQDSCESLTWHVFETPPAKVLDLGCGTGTWILNCARAWKDSEFVGLDIVPLQPDLRHVGSSDLASRVTWVHSNFLEGLPFPNEEFDFVHIKRIALGVPEDKWDFLLEEVTRVMKPGAPFEMFEEDLFFPGKVIDDDQDSEDDSSSEQSSYHNSNPEVVPPPAILHQSPERPPLSLVVGMLTAPEIRPRSSSLGAMIAINEQTEEDEAQDLLSQVIVDYDIPKHDVLENNILSLSTRARPQLHVSTPINHQNDISGSAISLAMSSEAGVAPLDTHSGVIPPTTITKSRARTYSVTTSEYSPYSEFAQRPPMVSQAPGEGNATNTSPAATPELAPFLLRTVPKPPVNPRDHSILEVIYTEMLESRFINLSPLALLANSLTLYFKDVRTHPPVQHAFPPVPVKTSGPKHKVDKITFPEDADCEATDSDDARDAILPSPLFRIKHRSSRPVSQSLEPGEIEPVPEKKRYVSVRNLIQHSSPYIRLDEARISAFSPSTRTTFPSGAKERRSSRLPNETIHLDLRALNLHLALRTAEVVACSESMWEWVQRYQDEMKIPAANPLAVNSSRSRSIDTQSTKITKAESNRNSLDVVRKAILELTREEFDNLLGKFEMDMRDKFSHSRTLKECFSWTVIPSPTPPERVMFETACEKWDRWELEHGCDSKLRPNQPKPSSHSTHTSPGANPHLSEGSDQASSHGRSIGGGKKQTKGSGVVAPMQRMSRAVRVFAAWKA